MSTDSGEFKHFTSSLAKQIRSEEKRRFVRLAIFLAVIALLLLGLLLRMQTNDHNLRQQLVNQCEARNQILDLQRQAYNHLVTSPDTPASQRDIWATILGRLPSNRNCQDFLLNRQEGEAVPPPPPAPITR